MLRRFALLVVLAAPAQAVELKQIEFKTGTAGLAAAPLSVLNAGGEAISCTAELAHWYSLEAGAAPPGARLRIALWFEPASGTYILLNAKQEQMPVEALWCGIAGRAHATRGMIALDRGPGGGEPKGLSCAREGERLRCQ